MSWPFRGAFDETLRAFAPAVLIIFSSAVAAPRGPAANRPDYPSLFGSSYRKAVEFVGRSRPATRAFESAGIEAAEAWAVVFPELIRWSALADLIQTSNLQSLYVQHGAGYSDFSVGRFQMKPSFAETLEADFNRLLGPEERRAVREGRYPTEDTVENRRARVRRLSDPEEQARYLIVFFKVMDRLYATESWAGPEEKVRFYAAAYNSGYKSGAARIRREADRSRYFLGLVPARPYYSYSDIAADYWRRASVKDPSSGL